MSDDVLTVTRGGYRYAKGVFQYSAGVAAEYGFEIERARFRKPLPLADGFRAIEAHLRHRGRPLAAFCACELRSPAPFTEAGFEAFNREYVTPLAAWGIYDGGTNAIARSNVCPELAPPKEPSFYAFSYTVPAAAATIPSFIISGSGEAPEGKGNYRDHIVRLGDTSPESLNDKARFVIAEMERRMRALGFAWSNVSSVQVYTVHDVHSLLRDATLGRAALAGGFTWHFARPPVVDLEFEMDVRCVSREVLI